MGCWLYISFLVVQNKRLSPVGWDTSALLDLAASIRLRFPSTPCPVLQYIAACVSRGMRFGAPRHSPPICLSIHRCGGRERAWKDAEWADETPTLFAKKRRRLAELAPLHASKIPMFSRCVTFGDGEMDFHDRRRHTYLWQPCCFFSWNQILKTRSARRLFCAVSWSSNLTRCRS